MNDYIEVTLSPAQQNHYRMARAINFKSAIMQLAAINTTLKLMTDIEDAINQTFDPEQE